MSGHSHWAGIKHKKEITDQKRGKVFSKLLRAITIAAKSESNPVRDRGRLHLRPISNGTNPDFNPRLRTAVETARAAHVPADSIKHALTQASIAGQELHEVIIECYGHRGAAIIGRAITDSKNRTVSEIKKVIHDHGGKWAEPGAVRWAFDIAPNGVFTAKFPIVLSDTDRAPLEKLLEALREYDDIEMAVTNAAES